MASGIQQNNGSPLGYGQPRRPRPNMQQIINNADSLHMQQMSPEVDDTRRGRGEPQPGQLGPSLYGRLPQGQPQQGPVQVGGRGQEQQLQPVTGDPYGRQMPQWRQSPQAQGGYGQQAQNLTGLGPTPGSGYQQGMPPGYAMRPQRAQQGVNPPLNVPQDQPMVDPQVLAQALGQGALSYNGDNGENIIDPTQLVTPEQYGYNGAFDLPQQGQLYQQQGQPGGLAAAQTLAAQNGYTDIEGAGQLKPGNFMGALEGFDTSKWGTNEKGSNTLKNSFGKIASNVDPTQPGAALKLFQQPDFQTMFPNAELQNPPKNDVIDFDGPGPQEPVDVITSAGEDGSGRGWAWQPQGGGLDAPMGGPGGPAQNAYMTGMPGQQQGNLTGEPPEVVDENTAMQYLQWLMAQQQPQGNQFNQEQYF